MFQKSLTLIVFTLFFSVTSHAAVNPPFVPFVGCEQINPEPTSYKSIFGWFPSRFKILLSYGEAPTLTRRGRMIEVSFPSMIMGDVDVKGERTDTIHPLTFGDRAAVVIAYRVGDIRKQAMKIRVDFGGTPPVYNKKAAPIVPHGKMEWTSSDIKKMKDRQIRTSVDFSKPKKGQYGGMTYDCKFSGTPVAEGLTL